MLYLATPESDNFIINIKLMETPKNQEDLKITPEKELEYTMDGINKEDWGEVMDCLTQFSVKIHEVSPSAAEREELKQKLDDIKNALSGKDIPEEYNDNINRFVQSAENAL
jgi:hypothetical protein